MTRIGRYVRGRLHRRLFVLVGVSIVTTMIAAGAIFALVAPQGSSFRNNVMRMQRYVGNRFAEVWSEPTSRAALAEGAAKDLELQVVLLDAQGVELSRHGPECHSWKYRAPVVREGTQLGEVVACVPARRAHGPLGFLAALAAAAGILWFFTGRIARRLVRPLDTLVDTARAIGEGELSRRTKMTRARDGEMGTLGETMDHMAARIEQQLADQRELLAVVSHEIRSPLARMRVHLELLEERGVSPETITKMTEEATEMDRLVGDLLASARLDFSVTDRRRADLVELARASLERLGLDPSELLQANESAKADVDPTLLGRALENLLENARVHAGGVAGVRIESDPKEICISVLDCGPGFSEDLREMAFDSFVRGKRGGGSSLGLGLSLVRRVAAAHGGRCWVASPPAGGAEVGFSVAKPTNSPTDSRN